MNVSVGGKNTFDLCMDDLTPECQERLKAFLDSNNAAELFVMLRAGTSGKQHGVKIHDLLCSDEFEFNAPFRIVEVGDIIEGSDVELTVVYNSESDEDIPEDILDKWICAINDNDEGGVDIEYSA